MRSEGGTWFETNEGVVRAMLKYIENLATVPDRVLSEEDAH